MARDNDKEILLEHARKYADMGLAVFPCKERGKTPCFNNWQETATTDYDAIDTIWTRNPQFNIAIATGQKSGGLIVIDVDNHDADGADSLKEWERENGNLPETATVLTGSGGTHYYYRSKEVIKGRAGVLPGVDIRADGNLIVAPPSIHPNGNDYEWDLGMDLDDPGIVEADEVVLKLVKYGETKTAQSKKFELPEKIKNGNRNDILFSYASSLQAKGIDDDGIYGAVSFANRERCEVPLDDAEVQKIVHSALTFDKGISLIKTKGKVRQCAQNVLTVLETDPKLQNHIMYNEFARQVEWFGPLPWNDSTLSGEWSDRDDSELKSYLDINYGLVRESTYLDGFNMCLNRHGYNPIIGWFNALEEWDGKPHIKKLLPRYTGAEETRYNYEALKLFMLGAINRAFNPGCKFDYVLVLVGEQGKHKSSFLQFLAVNDDWYDGNFSTIEGDKAVEKLRGRWILEMAELLAVKKQKDVEAFKAFVTVTEDSYRAPYERRTKHVKRSCVFAATTNDYQFMTDRTGNRRYLPIKINLHPIPGKTLWEDPEEARAEFRQAWAEAYHIFKTENPPLIMPQDMQREVVEQQSKYAQDDPWIGIIQEYLDNCTEERVCSKLIWDNALDCDNKQGKLADWNHISDIMNNNITGWHQLEKKLRCGSYGVQKCYERNKDDLVPLSADERVPF